MIDTKHYLALQIMPPIERICESIEGTDRARLAAAAASPLLGAGVVFL